VRFELTKVSRLLTKQVPLATWVLQHLKKLRWLRFNDSFFSPTKKFASLILRFKILITAALSILSVVQNPQIVLLYSTDHPFSCENKMVRRMGNDPSLLPSEDLPINDGVSTQNLTVN
jgi:hypothetical protein